LPFVLPSPPHHPADFTEDQFDFHSYCIRKMTLRAYLGLLRLEDRLHHHPFYMRVSNRQQAAACRCWWAHVLSTFGQ
jgi:peptide alpha-N-acetyltransferase